MLMATLGPSPSALQLGNLRTLQGEQRCQMGGSSQSLVLSIACFKELEPHGSNPSDVSL